MARLALDSRSRSLVKAIHDEGEEGARFYAEEISSAVPGLLREAVASGDVDVAAPVSTDAQEAARLAALAYAVEWLGAEPRDDLEETHDTVAQTRATSGQSMGRPAEDRPPQISLFEIEDKPEITPSSRIDPVWADVLDDVQGGPLVQLCLYGSQNGWELFRLHGKVLHEGSAAAVPSLTALMYWQTEISLGLARPEEIERRIGRLLTNDEKALLAATESLADEVGVRRAIEAGQQREGIVSPELVDSLRANLRAAVPNPAMDWSGLRLWVAGHIEAPLLETGLVTFQELFDRMYLPLKIASGATLNGDRLWRRSSVSGEAQPAAVLDGLTSIALDDRHQGSGKPTPVSVPFIRNPRAAWPEEVALRDPFETLARRAAEVATFLG